MLACIMSGCEYLNNIERVGLKVALKHFAREKSFAKVISFLRTNKVSKDRVPDDYETKAMQVLSLFKH